MQMIWHDIALELLSFGSGWQGEDDEFSGGLASISSRRNKTEDGKKPKFWKWLGQLKKECSLQHVKLISLRTGIQPKLNSSDKKQTARRQEKALTYNKNTILRYLSDHALFTRLEDC
uniref:Uncharacterized protein n=1 Tax=Ditylenchus dipsaci TaxID=166011 RepID=A0A915EPV9_9BILA